MVYKTPGVYVEEITTFPPSVVPVETAIPAFVGYTERAVDGDGNNLNMSPTRIKSLLEFEALFGGDFRPSTYGVELNVVTADGNNTVTAITITPRDANDNERRYYLYNSLRHFYANGGGPCYIVSVGTYGDTPGLGNATTAGLREGLLRLERLDEPTLLLFPDGVSLNAADLGALQQAALRQCQTLQDRFVIMDLRQGFLAMALGSDPVADFRQAVGNNDLKYGAAYYPWVYTLYRPAVHFRSLDFDLNFFDPAGNPLPAGTLDTLTNDADINALVVRTQRADATAQTVVDAVDISGMAGAAPLRLNRDNFASMTDHFAHLLELLRQTAVTPVSAVQQRFANLLLLPRAIALAFPALDADTTLPAELSQAVRNLQEDTGLVEAIIALIGLEKNADVLDTLSDSRTVDDVIAAYAALNGTPWIGENPNVTAISANTEPFAGDNERQTALRVASALQGAFDSLSAAMLAVFEAAEFLANEAEQQLFTSHPVLRDVAEQVKRTMSLLPIGGAVAGVYAAVDRTRGVWKAPANVSLADVIGPAVKINDEVQANLNVTTTGKSVNAIRVFTGKGTLVWGARTLAGNDNEWRYVSVRRFFNMAEESIKKSTEAFVFEPNDANTWVRVRAMIENFLTIQWRQGALAGATPSQAFFVKVGLGETMTAQDILEGRMIIEIGMAVVRPAEFIIVKFAHKMQVS